MPDRRDTRLEVVPYSDEWPALFDAERAALETAVGAVARSIEHIGSTAVPGLTAKPTIDILLVVDATEDFLTSLPAVEALGYEYLPENTFVGNDEHLFLRKVAGGRRTHHLHVLRAGSPEIDDYRLFRDTLRADPRLRRRYEEVKLRLARQHAADRQGYVAAKAVWVDGVLPTLRPAPPIATAGAGHAGGMARLAGLQHAALSVTDVERSARWYRDVLGLEEAFAERGDERQAVVLRLPGTGPLLALVHHAGAEPLRFDPRRTGLDHLALRVTERGDMDAWAARLAERGVEHDGPHEIPAGSILNFKDPDGIALALFWAR